MNYGIGSATLQSNGQYMQEVTTRGERERDHKTRKAGDNNLLVGVVGSSQSQVGPTTSSQVASEGH